MGIGVKEKIFDLDAGFSFHFQLAWLGFLGVYVRGSFFWTD